MLVILIASCSESSHTDSLLTGEYEFGHISPNPHKVSDVIFNADGTVDRRIPGSNELDKNMSTYLVKDSILSLAARTPDGDKLVTDFIITGESSDTIYLHMRARLLVYDGGDMPEFMKEWVMPRGVSVMIYDSEKDSVQYFAYLKKTRVENTPAQ